MKNRRFAPAHEFEEHTGEVRLRVEASTLPELFEEAARALVELSAGGSLSAPLQDERRVEVRASDRDALLIDWLNELVFLSETTRCVFPSVHVEALDDRELRAVVRGAEPSVIRTAVKAATMHGVHIEQGGDDRWTARVVLDV